MFVAAWKIAPAGIKVLILSSFLMSLGFYTLIPQLSLYLTGSLAWSLALTGTLLALRQFSQQGLMFFGGALSDRLGWKQAIVLGVIVRGIGFFSFAWSAEIWEFFLAALLSGLGGALFEPANKAAYEALTPRQGREQLIALRDVSSSVGFAGSALIGNLLIHVDFFYLSFLSGGLFFLAGAIVYGALPDIAVPARGDWRHGLKYVVKDRPFVVYTLMLTGYYYLATQLWITVPRVIMDATHDKSNVTLFYGVISLSVILGQLRVTHYFQNFSRRFALVALGTLLMGFGLFALGMVTTPLQIAIAGLIFAVGTMISSPVTFELVPEFAGGNWLASYYGFNGYALAFGGALSAMVGGWTYDVGQAYHFPLLPWVVCLAIGISVTVGLFFFETYWTRTRVTDNEGDPCPVPSLVG